MTKVDENPKATMTFMEHLLELRKCLLRSSIGVLIATLICLYWVPLIFEYLTKPIRENFGSLDIIGTGPAEAFLIKLKTAFIGGLLSSSPNTFFHLWRFVAPGMYENERKAAIPFVIISTVLFFLGTAFCFLIMFPFAFQYFYSEYQAMGIKPTIKVDEYMSFIVRLIFVFGVVFELPIVCFFMARLRLISHKWLIKNGRYSVIVVFIVAAILTPPDVISQILLAIPLMVIYLLCILIAWSFNPDRHKA